MQNMNPAFEDHPRDMTTLSECPGLTPGYRSYRPLRVGPISVYRHPP